MTSFLEIMADAVKTPNVVQATNKEGLFGRLEKIQVNAQFLKLLLLIGNDCTVHIIQTQRFFYSDLKQV